MNRERKRRPASIFSVKENLEILNFIETKCLMSHYTMCWCLVSECWLLDLDGWLEAQTSWQPEKKKPCPFFSHSYPLCSQHAVFLSVSDSQTSISLIDSDPRGLAPLPPGFHSNSWLIQQGRWWCQCADRLLQESSSQEGHWQVWGTCGQSFKWSSHSIMAVVWDISNLMNGSIFFTERRSSCYGSFLALSNNNSLFHLCGAS